MQSVFSTTDNSGEISDFEIEVGQDKVTWGRTKGSNTSEDNTSWMTEVCLISSTEETDGEDVKTGSPDQPSSKATEENKLMLSVPFDGTDLTELSTRPPDRDMNNLQKCETIEFGDWIIHIGEKEASAETKVPRNELPVAGATKQAKGDIKPQEKHATRKWKISPKCNMTTRLRLKMQDSTRKDRLDETNAHLQSGLCNSLIDTAKPVSLPELTNKKYCKPRLNCNLKESCTTHIRLQKTTNKLRRISFLQSMDQPINNRCNTNDIQEQYYPQEIRVNSSSSDNGVLTSELSDSLSVSNSSHGPDLLHVTESNSSAIKDEGTGLPLNSITCTGVVNHLNCPGTSPQHIKKRRKHSNLWQKGKIPKPKVSYKNLSQKFKVSGSSTDSSLRSSHSFSSETSSCVSSSPKPSMTTLKCNSVSNTAFQRKLNNADSLTSATKSFNLIDYDKKTVVGVPGLAKAELQSPVPKGPKNHVVCREIKNLIIDNGPERLSSQLKITPVDSPKESPPTRKCKSSTEKIGKRREFNNISVYCKEVGAAKKPKLSVGGSTTPPTATSPQGPQTPSATSQKNKVVKKSIFVPKIVLKKSRIKTTKEKKVAQKDDKLLKIKKPKAVQQKTGKSKDKLSNLATQKKKAIHMQLRLNKRRSQQTTDTIKDEEKVILKKTNKTITQTKNAKRKRRLLCKASKNKTVSVASPQTCSAQNASPQKAAMSGGSLFSVNVKSHTSRSTVAPSSSKSNQTPYISQSQLQLQHLASTFPLSPSSKSYLGPIQALPQNMLAPAMPTQKTGTKAESQSGQLPSACKRVGRPRKDVSSSVQSARMTAEHSLTGLSANKSAQGDYFCLASTVVAATCLPRVVLPQLSWPENNAKRSSVRQTECAFRYREIIVKKMDDFIQIVLASNTRVKNGLNCQVMYEMRMALMAAKTDSRCHLVVVHGTGSVFCSGIDLISLSLDKGQTTADKMSSAVRDFCKVLLSFPKPLVAAVNGAAVGLGVTFLPLFDLVYASDKATFYTPYCKLGQIPEGGATLTLPSIMGYAKANGLLLEGRRLTATEAHDSGLVTQVLWPASFMEEVIPRVQALAKRPLQAMESTKALVRYHAHSKLEVTLDTECRILLQQWSSDECRSAIRDFLQFEEVV